VSILNVHIPILVHILLFLINVSCYYRLLNIYINITRRLCVCIGANRVTLCIIYSSVAVVWGFVVISCSSGAVPYYINAVVVVVVVVVVGLKVSPRAFLRPTPPPACATFSRTSENDSSLLSSFILLVLSPRYNKRTIISVHSRQKCPMTIV